MNLQLGVDDPRADDVQALLATHLAFSRGITPAEYSFALDVEQLVDPAVTFFSARDDGRLLGIAAIKRLDAGHAELKSMHTRETDRGRGIAGALLNHVLAFARSVGYSRVSLETGTTDEFIAARTLYARAGFSSREAFGDYRASPYNTFMTLSLEPAGKDRRAASREGG